MSQTHSLFATIAVLALLAAPNVDRTGCGSSTESYKAAVAAVAKALGTYATCVAQSDKRDDCAAEMQALDNAHDNFVDAVGDAKDCH